ncbi:hypothetical protein IJG27_02010, partial [Candidatus Saccharibacteria bacterium]|nr:hypothetical protein [Candidatus Saccharibacteria bacterium]
NNNQSHALYVACSLGQRVLLAADERRKIYIMIIRSFGRSGHGAFFPASAIYLYMKIIRCGIVIIDAGTRKKIGEACGGVFGCI